MHIEINMSTLSCVPVGQFCRILLLHRENRTLRTLATSTGTSIRLLDSIHQMIHIQQALQILHQQHTLLRPAHLPVDIVQLTNNSGVIRTHELVESLAIINAFIHRQQVHHHYIITKLLLFLVPLLTTRSLNTTVNLSRKQIHDTTLLLHVRIAQRLARRIMLLLLLLRNILLRIIHFLIGRQQIQKNILLLLQTRCRRDVIVIANVGAIEFEIDCE
mmetsp:Transcript_21607/g.35108  ORF Transcript_21607/g.35108 Transcript_21607/m.35108 type:complete len:217 (+) Transcript_21607:252-902(+)